MHEFHWKPEYWSHLTTRQKAVIIAGIDIKVKEEERERKKAEKASHRH